MTSVSTLTIAGELIARQAEDIAILRSALEFIVDGAELASPLPVAVTAVARGALDATEPGR